MKRVDGKESKYLFVDDLSQPPSESKKSVDAEMVKKWLEHTHLKCEFAIHIGGTVMSKSELEKFTKKEQENEQTASED